MYTYVLAMGIKLNYIIINTNVLIILLSILASVAAKRKELTASSEALLWKPVNKTITGISNVWEAYVLVPADYESKDSPFIPINVRRFAVSGAMETTEVAQISSAKDPINLWYVPGGPGQSSRTLELIIPAFIGKVPPGSFIYSVDHRGLGKSTPLASEEDKTLLESYPSDALLLPEILERKQRELGILTPLTRALRVENVARDLLKSVQLSGKDSQGRRNFLLSVSYGTMIARRVLQLAPRGTFEAVILDGLAPVERIEISNESDRTIEEFCNAVPSCKAKLDFLSNDSLKVRGLIPRILSTQNSCSQYMQSTVSPHNSNATGSQKSLCSIIHEMSNAGLLQGRTSVKVGILRILFEMIECRDPEGFKLLVDRVHEVLSKIDSINHLQSAVIVSSSTSKSGKSEKSLNGMDPEKALSADELVFEVISALERYDVTESSMNICYGKKHTIQGDAHDTCPARLFDPCKFFQMTYERKMALLKLNNGSLPQISLQSPRVDAPDTRIMVLAGSLDFNTPTWISRQLTSRFIRGRSVVYTELFGLGHGIFGSTACDADIFRDFLTGSNDTLRCMHHLNEQNIHRIEEYFTMTLSYLSKYIHANT